MGDSLSAGNFTMAGAAFLRSMLQYWIVRIMAGHALLTGVMHDWNNLRKS
jgi:hypothetical protein